MADHVDVIHTLPDGLDPGDGDDAAVFQVTEHALDLPSHRVQAYHVVSVVYSTLWFGYEDTAVRRDDVHA